MTLLEGLISAVIIGAALGFLYDTAVTWWRKR